MTVRACSIEDCGLPHKGRGLCQLHLQRVWRQGDPHAVGVPHYESGPLHHNWAGDDIGYHGAHLRVRYNRGRAAGQSCAHGCGARAAQWAYDHADPAELRRPDGRPYSADPAHYLPLCIPCHRRFDKAHRIGVTA